MPGNHNHTDRAISRLLARVQMFAALDRLTRWTAIGLVAAGAVALMMRAGADASATTAMWALVLVPVGMLVGVVLSLRDRPAPDRVLALADARLSAGGALMTRLASSPTDDSALAASLDTLRPEIRVRDAAMTGAVGLVMTLGAILLPASLLPAGPDQLDLSRQVEDLQQDIQSMEQLEVIEPDQAQQLEDALAEINERAMGQDPAASLEALDWARSRVEEHAQSAADMLENRGAEASALEAMAEEALSREGASQSELARSIGEALEAHLPASSLDDLSKSALEKVAQSLKEASQNPGQCKAALESLKQQAGTCKGGSQASLSKLGELQLIDPSAVSGASARAKEAREAMRLALSQRRAAGDALAQCVGPGTGDVSRGPGAAVLTWRDKDDEHASAFDSQRLDSASVDVENSVSTGEVHRLPTENDLGDAGSSGGAIDASRPAAAQSSAVAPLPRHREAVRRYFDRPGRQPTPSEPSRDPATPAEGTK
jgi:hypothetical protein